MRVSAKAEYGCIAALELAANYPNPHPVRVKAIADAHGIPQRFLVQILLQLKGAGLVTSSRGALGGYLLARSPDKICLADIIYTIDSVPEARLNGDASPHSHAAHALRSVWHEVQVQEQQLLKEVTLADLVRRTQPSTEHMYQI